MWKVWAFTVGGLIVISFSLPEDGGPDGPLDGRYEWQAKARERQCDTIRAQFGDRNLYLGAEQRALEYAHENCIENVNTLRKLALDADNKRLLRTLRTTERRMAEGMELLREIRRNR